MLIFFDFFSYYNNYYTKLEIEDEKAGKKRPVLQTVAEEFSKAKNNITNNNVIIKECDEMRAAQRASASAVQNFALFGLYHQKQTDIMNTMKNTANILNAMANKVPAGKPHTSPSEGTLNKFNVTENFRKTNRFYEVANNNDITAINPTRMSIINNTSNIFAASAKMPASEMRKIRQSRGISSFFPRNNEDMIDKISQSTANDNSTHKQDSTMNKKSITFAASVNVPTQQASQNKTLQGTTLNSRRQFKAVTENLLQHQAANQNTNASTNIATTRAA